MSGFVKVDFGAIDGGVADIQRAWNQLTAEFNDLQANVNQLMSVWNRGTAREAYHGAQGKWNAGSQQMNQALQSQGKNMSQANQGYRSAESANTSMW